MFVRVRGQLGGMGSLLLLCEFQGSHSGHHLVTSVVTCLAISPAPNLLTYSDIITNDYVISSFVRLSNFLKLPTLRKLQIQFYLNIDMNFGGDKGSNYKR